MSLVAPLQRLFDEARLRGPARGWRAARALPSRNFVRRRLRDDPRVVHHVVDAALEQIAADVEEHQRAAEQEERDQQQRRDDADEDVGDDEAPPDAPQEALAGEPDQPRQEIGQRHQQADADQRVQPVDDGVRADGGLDNPEDDLQDDGPDQQPPRPAIEQQMPE